MLMLRPPTALMIALALLLRLDVCLAALIASSSLEQCFNDGTSP